MQNPDANQLPEVDSLPDGFVDSTTEPLAPPTPIPEQEKLPISYKDGDSSELGHSDDLAHELVVKEHQSNHDHSVEIPCSSFMQQTEDTQVASPVGNSDSEVLPSRCSEVKDQQGECQSSDRTTGECLETKTIPLKDTCSPEIVDSSKNKKPEPAETKRKSAKRTFKSEKEFLEFTLKYQQVLAERDAALAVRDKLESLCRELQRQNKMLMEECKRVSTEGQNLRLDLSAKFQDAIKDVGIKLEEQKDECLSQLKENEMLRSKLKQFADQYELSEQQYAQKLKQKTLELQIADLKIKQHEEKLVQEQSQMKVYAEQVSQLLATEKNLRLQLTADGEKFQQFQEALLKSNEVFETFKHEIEKMTKSIKELKKENQFLKSKSEKSDITLIELVDEENYHAISIKSNYLLLKYVLFFFSEQRERLKKQLEKTKNQKEKLESLCRSLQAERKNNLSGSKSDNSVPT
ncbi:alpha-taxilin isoform X2 [Senna tora]|uniref:Alpha-taxilin isoform X2 n=1 Tax=Senna tora TaxID=362788 RepID=A0A834TDE3_9FABA|nr:alpha-taxilin isoform X2 [Senna tora]